jgi:hypothetical protein
MMTPEEGAQFAEKVLRDLASHSVVQTAFSLQRMDTEGQLPKEMKGRTAVIAQTIENAIMLGITLAVDKPEWAHMFVNSIDLWVDDNMETQENHRRFTYEFVEAHPIEMEPPAPLAERGGDDELPDVGDILKDFSVGQEDQPED